MRRVRISWKALFFIAVFVILIMGVSRLVKPAASPVYAAVDESRVYYLSVPISNQDTLWSIAEEYYTEEFGSVKNYIKEIKECNSLSSDAIYAGNHIIIPVYNEETPL